MEKEKTLVIWLKNGETCLFKNVVNFDVEDEAITFHYSGVSTGVNRFARFNTNNFVGYALEV